MFDLTQLVFAEYVILVIVTIFLILGYKFNKLNLALIVSIESLATTFMVRHFTMSYYLYEGAQSDTAWILYNTFIIAAQCFTFYLVKQNPLIAFAYIINILVNITSFIIGSIVALNPENIFYLAIQWAIDHGYYLIFYGTIALIFMGLIKKPKKGRGNEHRYYDSFWNTNDNNRGVIRQLIHRNKKDI